MTIDCYCDYETPRFSSTRIVTARKPHKCYECGGSIVSGERYEYSACKYDDYSHIDQFRICECCYDLRQWVQNNVPCFCWAYGNMIDDAKYAVEDAVFRAPDETRGLRFGLLRRLVRLKWHNAVRREMAA